MSDDERIRALEDALAQVLKPLRGIPFSVVIKALSEHDVIPVQEGDTDDEALLDRLAVAATHAGRLVRDNPIRRPRPNEVGNDMEPFLMEGLRYVGFDCTRPLTRSGSLRTMGYPDALVVYDGKPTYVECKIYSDKTEYTAQRSFYLSPSEDFKVTQDARHVAVGFNMEATALTDGSRDSSYIPKSFKVVDLYRLYCDVKYEFNSDNRRLYADGMVLRSGRC